MTINEYPMAVEIFPRLCWGMISGDLINIMARITAYNTPIIAVHINIHIGMKTIYKIKKKNGLSKLYNSTSEIQSTLT